MPALGAIAVTGQTTKVVAAGQAHQIVVSRMDIG